MQPGTGGLCNACGHALPSMRGQGHPTPCARVRWDGARNVLPALVRAPEGESCPDFHSGTQGPETESAGIALEESPPVCQTGVNTP